MNKLNQFRGIIFDMDGLMFDTEKLYFNAWIVAFKEKGYTIDPHLFMDILGFTIEDIKSIFLKFLDNEAEFYYLKGLRDEHVAKHLATYGVPVKPGLTELLDYLKAKQYKMTIATSSEREKASFYLGQTKVADYFDQIVCREMVERGKPEPEIFLKACEIIDIDPPECLALEDSPAGILAAYRAGVKPVMIPDLVKPDDTVKKITYAVVSTLADVIPLLDARP